MDECKPLAAAGAPPRYCRWTTSPRHGKAMQLDPIKPTLTVLGIKRLNLNIMMCFQVLLSISICAATQWTAQGLVPFWMDPPGAGIGSNWAGDYTRPLFSST